MKKKLQILLQMHEYPNFYGKCKELMPRVYNCPECAFA
jgi:hypothetical protein